MKIKLLKGKILMKGKDGKIKEFVNNYGDIGYYKHYNELKESIISDRLFANLFFKDNIVVEIKNKTLQLYGDYILVRGDGMAQFIELKNDKKMLETGNIYIETHEKDRYGNWVESSFLREGDNTIWINYQIIKKELGKYKLCYFMRTIGEIKEMLKNGDIWKKEVVTGTSKGYLLQGYEIKEVRGK